MATPDTYNFRTLPFLAGILFLLFSSEVLLQAQPTGTYAHDPVMIEQDGTYYLFHTGRGVFFQTSTDMENWERGGSVFSEAPEWTYSVNPEFRNHMWAPDIIFHEGKYYLYYSVSAFGRNTSAIGVAANVTLDPDDPDYSWTDHGAVIQSVPGRDMWNAIDPNIAFDEDGTAWMNFGSYWNGIKLVKLKDNLTEIANSPQEWYTIASRYRNWRTSDRDAGNTESSDIEAPFIFKKNGYYYLFASWDRCCAGENSTYKVVVGRSEDIRGPYLDKSGTDMVHGGGTLVVKGNDEWAGVGHQAAYTFDGTDYLIFHGYENKEDGSTRLWINEINWDQDDWPTVSLN